MASKARIRKDLEGTVDVGGVTLAAGDLIPEGVHVGEHLVEGGKAVGASNITEAIAGGCGLGCVKPEPLTEDELAEAEALGIPTDVHPERVRGALLGFQVGVESVPVAEPTGETPPEPKKK